LIFPKPHSNCGKCLKENDCDCICHFEDITNGKHYEIHREVGEIKVKPTKDLEHFWD